MEHTAHVIMALQRGTPAPVAGASGYALVDDLIAAGFTVDKKRLDRVFSDPKGPITGAITITTVGNEIRGVVKGVYNAVLRFANGALADCDCDCPDWFQSGGKAAGVPCKHILGLAVDAGPQHMPHAAAVVQPVPAEPANPVATSVVNPPQEPLLSFPDRVKRAIGAAIGKLADQIEAVLLAGDTPFLIGPTGCGKTSAVRQVALRHGWGMEEVAGASSFADADLVGIQTAQLEHAGVLARAFRRARAGETTLILLDELTRFSVRVPDLLMRPLLPIGHDVAWAMQIPTEEGEAVRVVEAPVWGVEWAPVGRTPIVLAANPWGASLDPALVRRTVPLEVGFDAGIPLLFQGAAKTAIEMSWKAVDNGELPLPIEYQALGKVTGPTDTGFVKPYLARLRAVDRPAADGFKKLLEAAGVKL